MRIARHGFIRFSRFGDPDSELFTSVEAQNPPTDPSRETLLKDLRRLTEAGWAIAIVINDENRLNNLRGLLGERNVKFILQYSHLGLNPGRFCF